MALSRKRKKLERRQDVGSQSGRGRTTSLLVMGFPGLLLAPRSATNHHWFFFFFNGTGFLPFSKTDFSRRKSPGCRRRYPNYVGQPSLVPVLLPPFVHRQGGGWHFGTFGFVGFPKHSCSIKRQLTKRTLLIYVSVTIDILDAIKSTLTYR